MPFCVVLISAPQGEVAEKLGRMLVEEKLAACVNLVPQVKSVYWWEGKVTESDETLLIAKTDKLKVKGLIKAVKAAHPYSVPEVISLRIKEGNRDYLRWIAESLGTPPKKQRAPKGAKPLA
ncbi:MAG: divalent-cation tolerance protein CutA [candidate division FCPU426 bacterium]